MSLFFIIFFTVYTAVNSYIFIRGWQAIAHIPFLKPVYAIVFIFSASSYIIARILNTNIPDLLYDILLWTGSFWFAFMLYFFLFIIFIDFCRLLNHFFGIYPSFITANYQAAKFITFLSVLFISSMVVTAGYINTRNIKINYAEIEIPKKSSKLKELNLILVADFHLTPVNDGKLLKEIVEKINFLNADIVLMPGDILDDDVAILKKRNIAGELSNIKSKYGVFASNGNHEFIIGVEEADKYLHELNINVLRDSAVLIDNSFYVLGREDRSKRNFTGEERKTLAGILKDVNRNYPAIIIDHTPMGLNEIVNENIELQLSGHTHHGQIFPLNLITANIVYEVSWGYLRKGYTQFYVTCGVGTWGPPVRLGSDSEIVSMKIKFVE
ncbi:MAG TPA: metallophosphoesterase [Ignavibacteriaceae bacterium]